MCRTRMYASAYFIKTPPAFLISRSRPAFSSVCLKQMCEALLGNPRKVSWVNYIFFSEVFYGLQPGKNSQWMEMNLMHIHIAKEMQQWAQDITPLPLKVG